MANSNFGPYVIAANESNASRRMVYFSLYSASRETMPVTLGQNLQPALHRWGMAAVSTTSTARAADATNGLYFLVLTQSETTAVGMAMLRMSNTSIPETTVCIQFVAVDSGDSMRMGLFSQPNAAAAAAGGLPTFGTGAGQINPSGGSVGLVPGVMSGVSVEVKTGGIQTESVGVGNYSGVSVEIKTGGIQVASMGKGSYSGVSQEVTTGGIQTSSIGAGTYSSVTFQGLSNYANISNVTLAPGTHSNVTIQGVTRVNSGVTLNADTHSGATIQGVTRVNSSVTPADALYSAITVRIDPQNYSGLTVQGLANYGNIPNVTLAAVTHSGATIQGLLRINSAVTIADANYSAVTVRPDVRNYSGLTVGVNDIKPASYSGVSVEVVTGGIANTSFKASAIDAIALATDAGQEIADRILLRAVASGSDTGRVVQDALRVLRNRVALSASIGTVYQEDDTTSAWSFSVTTTNAASIVDFDPFSP